MHQIEISQKHQKSNFGLNVAMGLYSHWIHGADPIAFLHSNRLLDRFRQQLATDPGFLQVHTPIIKTRFNVLGHDMLFCCVCRTRSVPLFWTTSTAWHSP